MDDQLLDRNGEKSERRFWWVNQNQTYRFEVHGKYLWSPKRKANGGRNPFYDFMREVSPGDVVFSFCDTYIKAIGLVTEAAQTSGKPDFGKAGTEWAQEGWLVPVEFAELPKPIRPKDHIHLLVPLLPKKYAPLQSNGNGIQSVYLTAVSQQLAQALISLLGDGYGETLHTVERKVDWFELAADIAEVGIIGRTDIATTVKQQLIASRRGQGLFKANVHLNEKACRVTGIADPTHLKASHIKPWKDSNDFEKLHGCNGLLLAPHIDHLFDRGLLSFEDSGELMISPQLDKSVLTKWSIPTRQNVGAFTVEQAAFLTYHRSKVFKP